MLKLLKEGKGKQSRTLPLLSQTPKNKIPGRMKDNVTEIFYSIMP